MNINQKQKVINKLELDGHVSNFWAIENYILRLGAIIHRLKQKGWEFDTKWGEGNERKNFYYYVSKKPELKLF